MSAVEYTIYTLRLEDNKYYVGKTIKDIDVRFAEHLNSKGSEWTKNHPPIEVIETIKGDKWAEDSQVYRMIDKYGIDNVRGGKFCKIQLTQSELDEINKSTIAADDKCYKCHGKGHFAKFCTMNSVSGAKPSKPPIDYKHHSAAASHSTMLHSSVKSSSSHSSAHRKPSAKINNKYFCYKCGRAGHTVIRCFASTTIDGKSLK